MSKLIKRVCTLVFVSLFSIFTFATMVHAKEELDTCVATTSSTNKVDATNLLKNGDVAVEEFKEGEWENKAWTGFDTHRIKITWAWEKLAEGEDGYPIGFYQNVELQPNTYYELKFTAMEWNLSGKEQHSLKVGLANDEKEFYEGKVCEIAGPDFVNGTNYTYYVTFYSGELTSALLYFSTNYESPVEANNFGGFFFSDLSLNRVLVGAEAFDVTVSHPMQKSLYIEEKSENNLFINGDVAITDFENADCGWKNMAWSGFDGQRVKITYAWENFGDDGDGFDVGFYQDVEVEANTKYDISFTLMQWNLSNKPDHNLIVGFANPEDETNTLINSKTINVAHNATKDISITLDSGNLTKVRVYFLTKYENPNITGNFGGFFCSNFEMLKSVDLITNGDVSKEEFIDGEWQDLAWTGFDTNRIKITWAWEILAEGSDGFDTGFYQKLKVEKNTYYQVKFDVMQWNLSGKPQHALTVGFANEEKVFLENQSAVITGDTFENGTIYTYHVAFNSGDKEEVLLLFKTPYENPQNNNTFGGFFFDNFTCKKIVGQTDPEFNLSLTPAVEGKNYLYLGETADTLQLVPVIDNLTDFGLSIDDITFTYSSVNSTDIATLSETGLVSPGTKTGPFNVKVEATYDWYGKIIKGEATLKLRVIDPTSEDVLINPVTKPFTAEETSVLYNGDFENDPMDTSTTDHTLKADSWRSVIGGWMNTEAEAGYNGTTGAKITFRWQDGLTEDDWPCFYQDVAVEANTLYELSFMVYNWDGLKAGENDLIVGYRDRNATDIWENVQDYTIASPDLGYGLSGWTKVTVYLYTNNLTEIRLFAACKAQAGHDGGAGWWFDDFSLCKVTGIIDTENVVATGIDIVIPKTLRVNDNKDVSGYTTYTYGYRTALLSTIELTSSDPSVIEIKDGKLVAKKMGKVTITAKVGDQEVSQEVEVLSIPEKVEVTVGTNNTIDEGRDQKIIVKVTYSDGTSETKSTDCVFTISDTAIIAQKGSTMYLAGKKAGKATLSVEITIDGYKLTDNVEVTVIGEPVEEQPEPETNKGCFNANSVIILTVMISCAALITFCIRKRKF